MTVAWKRPAEKLLEVVGLTVAYGQAEVVHEVSLEVRRGEFVVLLGRNGAGKTTILHAISGLIPKVSGSVNLSSKDITRAVPRNIVRDGVIQVLEGHRVFTHLSIEDNLLIGTYAKASSGDRSKLPRIYELFPELADRKRSLASGLSGGQQQILAVAQGIIGDPQLLILDEPSGGLAPIVVDRILAVASKLCAEGVAVLLVEQLVEKAMRHADYCYLIETGRVVGQGPVSEVRDAEMLRQVFLGGASHDQAARR
ncbi:ABC transporter ATP-binding protein [Reyranella sp.]|uniref:ABC transporter ATP-binding protein n=1 Tax=Reyranella sp. TaxID=1929291 RepID=UPI003784B162